MKKSLFVFLLILLSINFYISKLEEMTEINSKYEQNEYLELFKIPNSLISSTQKLKDKNKFKKRLHSLNYASFFISTEKEEEDNYLLFNFQKASFIDKIIYYKNYMEISEKCLRFGEINSLKFFFKQHLDSKLSLIQDFKVVETNNLIIFEFFIKFECVQLKIEFYDSSNCSNINLEQLGQNNFLFLSPETRNINENILNAYDKNDYRRLTLSKEFNNEETIMNLEKE